MVPVVSRYHLLTLIFWRAVLQDSWRQALQIGMPVLTFIATGSASGSLTLIGGAFLAIAGGIAFTVLRALTGLKVSADQPPLYRALDRAFAAAAGTLLGLTTAVLQAAAGGSWSGFTDAIDHLDGDHLVYAVLASAVLAVASWKADKPVLETKRQDDGTYVVVSPAATDAATDPSLSTV